MNMKNLYPKLFCIAFLLTGVSFTFAAVDDPSSYALLLETNPADAGNVLPGGGVHKINLGETITLTAAPRPGYRFLYWVGDVGKVDSSRTTIRVDGPKMVVAVFGRENFEELPEVGILGGGSPSFSGDGQSGTSRSQSPSVNGGGFYPTSSAPVYAISSPASNEESDKAVPVPDVPEPATILMLGLGAVTLGRIPRKR